MACKCTEAMHRLLELTLSDLELSKADTCKAPKDKAERSEESQKDAIFRYVVIEHGREALACGV